MLRPAIQIQPILPCFLYDVILPNPNLLLDTLFIFKHFFTLDQLQNDLEAYKSCFKRMIYDP